MHAAALVAAYLVVALLTTLYVLRQVPDEHGPLAPDWIDRFVLLLTAFLAGAAWPLLLPFTVTAWWRSRSMRAFRARTVQRLRPRGRIRPFAGVAATATGEPVARETSSRLAS